MHAVWTEQCFILVDQLTGNGIKGDWHTSLWPIPVLCQRWYTWATVVCKGQCDGFPAYIIRSRIEWNEISPTHFYPLICAHLLIYWQVWLGVCLVRHAYTLEVYSGDPADALVTLSMCCILTLHCLVGRSQAALLWLVTQSDSPGWLKVGWRVWQP